MWVASSVWTKKASCDPFGDQVALETRAPLGIWICTFRPSAAEMTSIPTLVRMVRFR